MNEIRLRRPYWPTRGKRLTSFSMLLYLNANMRNATSNATPISTMAMCMCMGVGLWAARRSGE